MTLSHGRTRKRRGEKVALAVVIVAGALAFVAGALALAAAILILTT